MQAITTKYIPCTNTKGSRIKATCERGSITIPHPHELSGEAAHEAAVNALCEKFAKEDLKEYGTPIEKNPWLRPKVCGGTKIGCVFVFIS